MISEIKCIWVAMTQQHTAQSEAIGACKSRQSLTVLDDLLVQLDGRAWHALLTVAGHQTRVRRDPVHITHNNHEAIMRA